MIDRGGIYWADLGAPVGSLPAKRRPVLVVSADSYNRSRLATILAAVITSNTSLVASDHRLVPDHRLHLLGGDVPHHFELGVRPHISFVTRIETND